MRKIKQLYTYIALFFLPVFVFAKGTGQEGLLLQLSEQFHQRFLIEKADAVRIADSLGLPVRIEYEDGRVAELMRFKRGVPMYYTTYNANGASVINSDKVYPGGVAGLNLTGAGQTLGMWDGGRTRLEHDEFGGRVTQVDGSSSNSNHATHVAGTMVAAGVDSDARGMSYEASLDAYDWNNDGAEMAAAAANGLQVSQHSYGYITGWAQGDFSGNNGWHWFGDVDVSTTEDYYFGFYSSYAQDWDQIAFNAPNYLIVKSAGNDRGRGPAAGTQHWVRENGVWVSSTAVRDLNGGSNGYDCISHQGVSKNVLSVGAVHANGNMSSFSSWGPADDGRVKPDIVAKGVSVYSSTSGGNGTYGYMSGTSMSGPMVSGSVGLLMQHQENLHPGQPLLSSTKKALILHSADDMISGAPGPDYRFGWGMMNTRGAVEIMSENANNDGIHISELTITNGSDITIPVKADGAEPLRATIVWTDVPGTPVAPALNPTTPMLVNDLDMRITDLSMTEYLPYILDPANPTLAATTGDNFRDNVEMIHIEAPSPGEIYNIQISHKGTLSGGSQDFSFIITGNIPMTSVTNPPSFTATTAGTDQIELEWVQNTDFDDVMVVYYDENVFGTPDNGTVYTPGQIIPGGGIVLYRGSALSYTHSGLAPVTDYYYRAYSFDASNDYSSGRSAQATTLCGVFDTLPFTENFDASTELPDCWEIIDHEGNGQVWEFGTHSGGLTGTTGNYAFLNSDAYGSGNSQNSDLISPVLDLSAYTNVTLSFAHYFEVWDSETASLYYSVNNGESWNLITQWTSTTFNPAYFDQEIAAVAGQPAVRFRWNYTGTWGWSWNVDDIVIDGMLAGTVHTVSLSVNPPEGGSTTGAGVYAEGATVSINAMPATGYGFVNWTGDTSYLADPVTSASNAFVMPGNDVNLVANFSLNSYQITAVPNNPAFGEVTGGGTYNHGDEVTLTATPTGGYHFVAWEESGDEVSTDTEYTFMAEVDRTLIGVFAINTYTLEYTAGANGYLTGETLQEVEHGSDGSPVEAIAGLGHSFTGWSDGVTANPRTDTNIQEAISVTAYFAINSYEITAAPNNPALGEVDGAGIYEHGELVTITATPYTGAEFIEWTEDGVQVSSDAEYSFTATGDRNLVAHFATVSYLITAEANNPALGEVDGGGIYDHGQLVTLAATPYIGAEFLEWTEDGVQVSTDAEYTFTAESDRDLIAHFAPVSYLITAAPNNPALGEVDGDGTYFHGEEVILSATAYTGAEFVEWTENGDVVMDGGVPASAVYSFTATEDRDLVAHFAIKTYLITATAANADHGSVTGGGVYAHGATVSLVASANPGYEFVDWKENGATVTTNATFSFTATEDRDLVAHFAIKTYDITATPANPAHGSITGGGTYDHGDAVTVTATPATGYSFVEWTENGAVVMDGDSPAGAIYSFTATEDRDLVAHFVLVSYLITAIPANPDHGSVTGGGIYVHGATVNLFASANPGYEFVDWKENGAVVMDGDSPADAIYSFTATEDRDLVAHFSPVSYLITATPATPDHGSVTGGGAYDHGEAVTVTAIPVTGYSFVEWTENGAVVMEGDSPADAIYSFMATEDRDLVAHFTPVSYLITATPANPDHGSVTGGGTYDYGEQVTVTATPATGYEFVEWTENGAVVMDGDSPADAIYSFMATEDRDLVAHFALKTYDITAIPANPDHGSVTGGGTYDYGEQVTVTATPNTGYHFVAWEEEGVEVSTDAEYTFTAVADRSLIGLFAINTYTLEYTAGANGSLIGATFQEVEHGSDGTPVEAIADAGYSFMGWSDALTDNPRTDTNVQEAISVTAHFAIDTYAIAAEPNNPAFGEVDGAGIYDHGEEVTLTATPNLGYNFDMWTEYGDMVTDDGVPVGAVYSFTALFDRNLVAHFTPESYLITAEPNNPAFGEVTGGGIYDHGTLVTLAAIPTGGYHFVAWEEKGVEVSTDAEYTFTAEADRSLIGLFAINTYTLEYTAGANGSLIGATFQEVEHSSDGTPVEAIADPGYTFAGWSDGLTLNPRTDTNVEGNISVTAHFVINTYAIAAEPNNTAFGEVTGGGIYEHGEEVTLTATPNPGYSFEMWTEYGDMVMDDGVPAGAVYSFTALFGRNLVAHFTPDNYAITAEPNNPAFGEVDGTGIYEHGEEVTLTATPNPGYSFEMWTEYGDMVMDDGVPAGAVYSFTALFGRNLVAHFTPEFYLISAEPNNPALGEVDGGGIYDHGQLVTLVATPYTGADFVEWTEGGVQVSTDAQYSFTATGDRNLVAHFATVSYLITAEANNPALGEVDGGGIYDHGQLVTLIATPYTGAEFVEWTEGGVQVSTDSEYSFTAAGDRNLVAHFATVSYLITAEANNPALGEVDGDGTYIHGEEVMLLATAYTGAEFVEWTENGDVVMDGDSPAGAVYSFTAIDDRILVAHFVASDPGIPGILFLEDQLVATGELMCFGAFQTIYTAGDEGDFIVMYGAQVDLIAGKNIIMLPGTKINAGASLHARIAPDGPFCEADEEELIAGDRDKQETDTNNFIPIGNPDITLTGIQDLYRIFPNPTDGLLTLEIIDLDQDCNIHVQVFNMMGQLLLDSSLPAISTHSLSISDYDPGMYIVRVVHCNRVGYARIQKR